MQSGVKHQLWLLSASWLWYKCSLQKLNIQQNQDHMQSWAKYQLLLLSASWLWYNSLYRSWISSRTWSETLTLVTFCFMVMIQFSLQKLNFQQNLEWNINSRYFLLHGYDRNSLLQKLSIQQNHGLCNLERSINSSFFLLHGMDTNSLHRS